jgi:hypothetical protein
MSFLSAIPIIGDVLKGVFGIIDKAVVDKDEAERLKATLKMDMMGQQHDEIQALLDSKTKIILAEAQGGWLQRNWRPLLMLIFMIIIANNYIMFPYISLFFPGKAVMLVLPDFMWELLKIGVGGYVVGRSVEKGISTWKNGS